MTTRARPTSNRRNPAAATFVYATLAVMATALLAGPAAALPPDPTFARLAAQTTTFSDELVSRGQGIAMVLNGGPGPSIITGTLRTGHVLIEQIDSDHVVLGPEDGIEGITPPPIGVGNIGRPPTFHPMPNATIEIITNDPSFRMHILAPEDGPTFGVSSVGKFVEYKSVDRLRMDLDGLQQAAKPDRLGASAALYTANGHLRNVTEPIYGPWNKSWTTQTYDDPWIIATAAGGDNILGLAGNFIIEMTGVTVRVENAETAMEIKSGLTAGPLREDLDPYIGAAARYQNSTFLRLYVKQAEGQLQVINPEGMTQYALKSADAATQGRVVMEEATGSFQHGGETTDIMTPRTYMIAGRYSLTAAATAENMRLDLVRRDAPGPLASLLPAEATVNVQQAQQVPMAPLLIVAGAVFVLAVAAVGRFWALRRCDQEDLEAALEAQAYGRAARIGQQLLKRNYEDEEAAIGRAIALTKGGAPSQAVVELHERFREGEPSDGVLHYVLGLAHVALQQREQARSAFTEAVRRTPALLPELQANPDTAGVLPKPSVAGTGPFGSGTAYV